MEQDMLSSHYKMWTREATTMLIQQYEVNECMWMTTSPFYRNKQKRGEALINIAVAVCKYRPQTTAEDIKNKINGIRTQYVSEINKLILAGNRGEPYEPTLWCFDMLTFLKPFTQPKQKMSLSGNVSAHGNFPRTFMPKSFQPQFPSPQNAIPRPILPQGQPIQSLDRQKQNKNCIIIKEEAFDNDVEIIEEEDNLNTDDDYSSHSSFLHEDKTFIDEEEPQKVVKEATPPLINADSGFEEENRVKKFFSPPGISAEITLVPKKNLEKRKIEEIDIFVEEKKKKNEMGTNTENKEDDRVNIFGKFVMSQMKTITDKVLLLKLEHTIQNAIIEAQLKQIELDEIKKENETQNN